MATADQYADWIVKNQSRKGTPEFDTVAKAYEEAKATESTPQIPSSGVPGPRRQASTMDILTSAPYKAVAGMADIFLTAPQNVANLAKMGYGTAVTAAGRPDLAPEVTAPRQPVSEAFQRAGLIRQPQGETTPFQRMLDVGVQGATGAVLGSPQSIAAAGPRISQAVRGATTLAATGGAAGAAGQATTEATGSPTIGAAVSMAVPGAAISAAQARQARLQTQEQANAVRDLTIRQAQAEGYKVTPGSVTPSAQNILIERMGGKTATQQKAAVLNQDVTDRLARRAVGLPENAPLTRAGMQQIRQGEYQRGYEPLNRIGAVQTDQQFNQALDNVLTAYTGPGASFPNAIPQPVRDLVQNYRVGQFNSADAVSATRTLREQANNNIRAGGDNAAVGLAQRAISNALEDQIERSLQAAGNPNTQAMLDQFRASRQRMAVSHAIEDAIVEGGGSVNARTLANDLQTRGKYFTGDLDLIARFANVARPVMTQPGTAGTPGAQTLLGTGLGGGLGAAGGYAMGGAPGASLGGMAGAIAPSIMSAAARNYLLTPFAQGRAVPTYQRPGVNALAAGNEAVLRAMMGVPTFTNQNALVAP